MYASYGYSDFGLSGGFEGLIDQLYSIGFFNIVLPFLVIFSITFAILKKTSVFGDSSNISKIIALSISAYVTVFSPFAAFLIAMTAKLAVILVGLLFFFMIGVMAFSFKEHEEGKNPFIKYLSDNASYLIWGVLIVGFMMFYTSGGLGIFFAYLGLPPYAFNGMFGFFVVLLVFWWMLSPSKDETEAQKFGQYKREMEHLQNQTQQNFGGGAYPQVIIAGGQQPTFDQWKKQKGM